MPDPFFASRTYSPGAVACSASSHSSSAAWSAKASTGRSVGSVTAAILAAPGLRAVRLGRACAVLSPVAENYIAELPFGSPKIDHEAFVAPTAVVVGAVTMGPRSSIWYGAVARADAEVIEIGEGSNIQDGRSEEHTSELQSRQYLVCRLL